MKKAFTLTELMIALAIIGTMAVIFVPFVAGTLASTDKIQYKSAFNQVESVVSDMINDTTLYPNGTLNGTNSGSPTDYDFCTNFAGRVNIIGSTGCTTSTVPGTPNFITSNGMRWYLFNQDFDAVTGNQTFSFEVDINGASKGSNANITVNPTNYDILKIQVSENGRMTAPTGGNEEKYLTQ